MRLKINSCLIKIPSMKLYLSKTCDVGTDFVLNF